MSRLDLAILAAAAAMLSPSAARACDVTITPRVSTLQLAYDPFAPGRASGQYEFDLENSDSAACEVDLVLLDAAGARTAESELDGLLLDYAGGSGDAALVPTAVPGVWRVAIGAGQRVKLSLAALVSRDAVVSAGDHALAMTLELHDAGVAAPRSAPLPIRLVVTAPPRAQMNIVGAAGTFGEGTRLTQVDFGEMTTGAVRRVFLQLRANTPARLLINSANHGRLALDSGDEAAPSVPYAAELDGQVVDLRQPWSRDFSLPPSIAGTSVPLDLKLGTVDPRPAGHYSDTITIEFSAL